LGVAGSQLIVAYVSLDWEIPRKDVNTFVEIDVLK